MKKVFTFVGALLISAMAMAVTITSADLTISSSDEGFTVTDQGYTLTAVRGEGSSTPTKNDNAGDLRLYAKNQLTVSGSTMTKMVFTVSAKGKYRQAEITASTGSVVVDATNWTVTWTGEATSVVLTVGEKAVYGTDGATKAGQFDFDAIEITSDEEGEGGEGEGGEGEGGEGQGGEIVISDLYYVDAVFYEDETYGDYWSFDFYKDLDEEGYILAPYVYFVCNESTTSSTKIAGTWTAYEAGYYETIEEESGVFTDEEVPVGSLTVTCAAGGLYNFAGSFVGEDGKTYKWNLNNMEVYAYNGDTYEDISLDDYQPTAVENTEANVQSAIKTLRNGQVLIQKNNKVYTVLGQEVK